VPKISVDTIQNTHSENLHFSGCSFSHPCCAFEGHLFSQINCKGLTLSAFGSKGFYLRIHLLCTTCALRAKQSRWVFCLSIRPLFYWFCLFNSIVPFSYHYTNVNILRKVKVLRKHNLHVKFA